MYAWRTGRSCVFKNHVHLVFVTKYRRGVFTAPMLERLAVILSETCRQMDCELLEFGGEDDHVHCLVAVPPKLAVSTLVAKLKGKSSYVLRREFWTRIKTMLWGEHFWSPSYCVVSSSDASLDVIEAFIDQQRTPPSDAQVRQSQAIMSKSKSRA